MMFPFEKGRMIICFFYKIKEVIQHSTLLHIEELLHMVIATSAHGSYTL